MPFWKLIYRLVEHYLIWRRDDGDVGYLVSMFWTRRSPQMAKRNSLISVYDSTRSHRHKRADGVASLLHY